MRHTILILLIFCASSLVKAQTLYDLVGNNTPVIGSDPSIKNYNYSAFPEDFDITTLQDIKKSVGILFMRHKATGVYQKIPFTFYNSVRGFTDTENLPILLTYQGLADQFNSFKYLPIKGNTSTTSNEIEYYITSDYEMASGVDIGTQQNHAFITKLHKVSDMSVLYRDPDTEIIILELTNNNENYSKIRENAYMLGWTTSINQKTNSAIVPFNAGLDHKKRLNMRNTKITSPTGLAFSRLTPIMTQDLDREGDLQYRFKKLSRKVQAGYDENSAPVIDENGLLMGITIKRDHLPFYDG